MSAKIKSYDRTVVAAMNVQIADINLRQTLLRETFSAKLPINTSLTQSDSNVSSTQFLILNNISTVVMINSWSELRLDIIYTDRRILDVPCSGLFLFFGQITQIVVKGIGITPSRVACLYA